MKNSENKWEGKNEKVREKNYTGHEGRKSKSGRRENMEKTGRKKVSKGERNNVGHEGRKSRKGGVQLSIRKHNYRNFPGAAAMRGSGGVGGAEGGGGGLEGPRGIVREKKSI